LESRFVAKHAGKSQQDKSKQNPLRLEIHWTWWLLAALIAVVISFMAWRSASKTGRADPDDPKQVALGEKVYAASCAECHGANLEGQPDWQTRRPDGKLPAPPHDVSGHTWHHPNSYLFDVTKHGVQAYAPPGYQSDMPGFADKLSDDEIWAVIAFIESKWPRLVRQRHAEMEAMGMK
jgi:mono/diheme cytochrome c family protein